MQAKRSKIVARASLLLAVLTIGFAAGALWQRHCGSNYEQEIAYHMRQMQRHADALRKLAAYAPQTLDDDAMLEPWEKAETKRARK